MDSRPHHDGFTPATSLANILPDSLSLPAVAKDLVGSVITQIEGGCVNMIQSDRIKEVHSILHHIMVDAIDQDWHVTLVDLANCFNPQKISNIAFEYGLHSQLVLQRIGLARPFQIHQAVSIIKGLVQQITKMEEKQNLVVITDISSLFFDPGLANEDPNFPIPQLELMRQCVGILQSLAVQGCTILITDTNERVSFIPQPDDAPQVNPASLKYSSKLHIRIENTPAQRRIELVSHPYLPTTTKLVRDLKSMLEAKKPRKQMSLSEFF